MHEFLSAERNMRNFGRSCWDLGCEITASCVAVPVPVRPNLLRKHKVLPPAACCCAAPAGYLQHRTVARLAVAVEKFDCRVSSREGKSIMDFSDL